MRQQEHGIDAAHFGVHRNRFAALRRGTHQRQTALSRTREGDCLDRGMADQGLAERMTVANEQGKHALWQVVGSGCLLNHLAYQFRRTQVSLVCLDHYRAASGQGSGAVAAGNRKRQGKIACTKYSHRAERDLVQPQVGARREARRQSAVQGGAEVVAVAHHLRKEPQLAHGAAPFDDQARCRQSGFERRAPDQRDPQRQDARGDRFQKLGTLFCRGRAVAIAGLLRQRAGLFNVSDTADAEVRAQRFMGGRVDCRQQSFVATHCRLADEHFAGNHHVSYCLLCHRQARFFLEMKCAGGWFYV